MSERSDFGERLTLALKALNLSRAQLAASVAVDKSLVSRWLSGQVVPTGHNLARISDVLAKARPGFNATYWDRSRSEFDAFLDIVPIVPSSQVPSTDSPIHYPASLVEAARNETSLRGAAYEGFWLATRPSLGDANRWARDIILVRKRNQLLHVRCATTGAEGDGWLFPLGGFLECILHDKFFGRFAFLILNDAAEPRVEVLEGLMMAIAFGAGRAPTATHTILHRVHDLSPDSAENDRRFDEMKERYKHTEASDVPENIQRHLVRDTGPAAFAKGGTMLLQALRESALKG